MNRHSSYTVRLVAGAAVLGLLAAGCARHDGGVQTSNPTVPSPVQSTSTQQPTPAATPNLTDIPAATDSAGPDGTQPTTAPQATASSDPIDSEIQAIGQLLNGVNSSINGSDSSTSGGE